MEFNELIKAKKQTLISFFLIFLLLGAVFTGLQTFKYGASSKLLVIQEGASGVDPFAVSRSVEYLSGLFSQVVYSNSFFNLVKESGFNIDQSYFSGDSIKQMKLWQKTVSAKSVENTGVINLTVYHPSAYQAKQIALAVNHVLMTQNSNYQGIGSSVKITVMDEPLVSNYPNQPNLLINFGFRPGLCLYFSGREV
jgi:capsular polysaccharide biosynthesis protein